MIRTTSHKRLVEEARARRVAIEALTATVPDGHGGSRTTARQWELYHEVAPASSEDAKRTRTPYFYIKMAVEFSRESRNWLAERMFPGHREVYVGLAKAYLKSYREMKGVRS